MGIWCVYFPHVLYTLTCTHTGEHELDGVAFPVYIWILLLCAVEFYTLLTGVQR